MGEIRGDGGRVEGRELVRGCSRALRLASLFALVALGSPVTGCDKPERVAADPASLAECEQMRAHVVDLQLVGLGDDDVRTRHRENLVASTGDAYLDECRRTKTHGDVQCALAAEDPDALRACTNARGRR